MTHAPAPIYIISGGTGSSGEQVVHTVLAQFGERRPAVLTIAHVRQPAQITEAVARAAQDGGLIVHTLVQSELREHLLSEAAAQQVEAIDLMGSLVTALSTRLETPPLEQPGLYRRLNQDYFERIAAIDFTMAHDDGKHPEGWKNAEIMLTGVSRAGKTPLSMYLAVLGWKVANLPLVKDIPTPPEIFELDPRRVIGLRINPAQLIQHRRTRQQAMGVRKLKDYSDYESIEEELQAAQRVFLKGGFSTIDVTDKPIESSANEIIALISRRFGAKSRGTAGPY